jgi:hypothetical protein
MARIHVQERPYVSLSYLINMGEFQAEKRGENREREIKINQKREREIEIEIEREREESNHPSCLTTHTNSPKRQKSS